MANASLVQTVATDGTTCSVMVTGAADYLPCPTEPGLDAARLPGLLATDQLEDLLGGERESEFRELSYCNRRCVRQ
jgi:hypothetical protein